MNIPFRVKLLTKTAKAPTQENKGALWDLYADDFCIKSLEDAFYNDEFNFLFKKKVTFIDKVKSDKIVEIGSNEDDLFDGKGIYLTQTKSLAAFIYKNDELILEPQGRILVKTGISLELPINYSYYNASIDTWSQNYWFYEDNKPSDDFTINSYAVADINPLPELALKYGITILNAPVTIDNSYCKEIGVILYNAGHEPYTIRKGDKIAQMLIKPLYPSQMEVTS